MAVSRINKQYSNSHNKTNKCTYVRSVYHTVTKRQFYLLIKSKKLCFLKNTHKLIKIGCIFFCSLDTPCTMCRSVCFKESFGTDV